MGVRVQLKGHSWPYTSAELFQTFEPKVILQIEPCLYNITTYHELQVQLPLLQ